MNLLSLLLPLFLSLNLSSAQLRRNFYAGSFPNVEQIVRNALGQKIQQSSITVPVVLRLYFHDCFVNGCDASVMIESTKYNKAEKDHPDNLSLSGDGFDAIVKAKQALDAVPNCRNKVSCADIITIATRDVVNIVGGPWYDVELGRLDGLSSTAASVEGMLPQPTDDVNKLTSHFAKNGLSLDDMIHGVKKDPSINATYLPQLKDLCPKDVDPRKEIFMDPITPGKFDNVYYQNLQQGRGLFKSDQALFTDPRSKPTVNLWASNGQLYNQAFVN
uniref:peroxidase n=1 Tax=Brassica oleracea var. oleracea TaxID=109376 RepID=A0A0D3A179_BRAOL